MSGDYRLALVSAPAGYGKTATLSSWAAELDDPAAWLSCDPADAEPTRFMSGLLAAISTQWPGAADDAFVLLEHDGVNVYDAAVAVANELATVGGRGAIVVDDLHLAAPAPALLTAFIDALPDGFRFVAGTRSDPPLPLSRFRVRGELLELRGDDLRFDPDAMSDFFDLDDIALPADDLIQLHELTEGWPAGAQLAAIALQRGAGRDDFLEAFAKTDRAVSDFLLSEVLAGLPADLVEFMTKTSVLDTFDIDLCRAVTGVDEAAAVIDRLIAANLFIVPLDDRARWYRYHHLFAAFLRARLASIGSADLRAAHDVACRALEERGDVGGALRHAMAMADTDRAGRILRASIARTVSVSEPDDTVPAVRLWLHEYGESCVESDPQWVLELVLALIALTGPDDATIWIDRVRAAHPDAGAELTALVEGVLNEHYQSQGQPLKAIGHARKALEALGGSPPSTGVFPLIFTSMGRAHLQAGQVDEAAALIEHVSAHPVGSPVADEVRHPAVAAYLAAAAGEMTRADELARRAIESADRIGLGRDELGRIIAGLALAELHLERDEDAIALDHFDDAQRAGEASHRLTLRGELALGRARVARITGDEAGAVALLATARLFYVAPDAAVRHRLSEEAVAQALRFAPSDATTLLGELDPDRVETQVLRVRVALLERDDQAAAALLGELPPARTRRGRTERAVLCALSLLDRDVEQANRHAAEALAAGQPEWLIRTIIDQGPEVHKLLLSFTPDANQEEYLDALLAAVSRIVAPTRVKKAPTLVDPLSPREVTVLRYLCSRLTYQEIAAALFVSLNTLKSHVRAVYRKLDVATRADAVDAGRRLGLI